MDRRSSYNAPSQSFYVRMTVKVVGSYVVRNTISASDLPGLIASTAAAFVSLETSVLAGASTTKKVTQAEIRLSITHEALISFEDGKRYKTLKRHLTACGLTPETYRAKWGLPRDYPMVAPGYSERRSSIATGPQSRYANRSSDRNAQEL